MNKAWKQFARGVIALCIFAVFKAQGSVPVSFASRVAAQNHARQGAVVNEAGAGASGYLKENTMFRLALAMTILLCGLGGCASYNDSYEHARPGYDVRYY